MRATQREFTDIKTNQVFRLFTDDATGDFALIKDKGNANFDFPEGTEVNGFFICAHTPVTIKLNTKKEIKLQPGTFYNVREDEKITHKKYVGFKRFTKI